MSSDKLLKITKEFKLEILSILHSYDLSNDQEARQALNQINALYDRLGIAIEEVMPYELLQAYFQGVNEAEESLSAIGIALLTGVAIGLTASSVRKALKNRKHMEAIINQVDNTLLDLRAAIRTARLNTNRFIINILEDVTKEVQAGVINVDKKRLVTAKVAQAFEKYGMTAFITSDGKQLPLDFYSEVVTRTNMRNAEVKGTINLYMENGQDLVKIDGVTPTCHYCWAHRGVIFSLSGKDERFPAAEGNLPPYHPNCMCEVSAYYENEKRRIEVEADIEKAGNFNPTKDNRPKNIKDAYDKRQARNRVNNYEKKRYAKMKAVLGDEAPKTIGAFKRMKRTNTESYQKLWKKYKEMETE